MSRKSLQDSLLAICLLALIGTATFIVSTNASLSGESIVSTNSLPSRTDEAKSLHQSYFYQTGPLEVLTVGASVPDQTTEAWGGIVSHHLLTADSIASFFKGLKNQNVESVVLLGPNHRNSGRGKIIVSKIGWQTPYGILESNSDLVDKLIAAGAASLEEDVFETEHSIYTLTPFIKKAFPNSLFLPIIFMSDIDTPDLDALSQFLIDHLGQNSLVIASVDFTHDQNANQAYLNDQKSLEVLKNLDLQRADTVVSDSNQSLYVLLAYLKAKQAKPVLIERSDSFLVSGENPESVTSYIFMYFSK